MQRAVTYNSLPAGSHQPGALLDVSTEIIMRKALSATPLKHVAGDGSVSVEHLSDEYYLENDVWELSHFLELDQFESDRSCRRFYKKTGNHTFVNHKLHLDFSNARLKLEVKFTLHQMLFSDKWSLVTVFTTLHSGLARLKTYVNERHPGISSFDEMQSGAFMDHYKDWLVSEGIKTVTNGPRAKSSRDGKDRIVRSVPVDVVSKFHVRLHECLNLHYKEKSPDRLWSSDLWELGSMRSFGFSAVGTQGKKSINFEGFNHEPFKGLAKRYLKDKLLMRTIVWSTAQSRAGSLKKFFNFIHDTHPEWNDLRSFSRSDVMLYVEHLSIYAASINSERYVSNQMSCMRTCLADMQDFEYPEMPKEDASRLIRRDLTRLSRSYRDERDIKQVPDIVLEQLFNNFDGLSDRWKPIVLTMFYTGQRVSDVLEMKQDCLVTIDGETYLQLDIRKTKVKSHRVPIPEDLAEILRVEVGCAGEASNDDNNPERYLFVHYRGPNKGRPYNLSSVSQALNVLAQLRSIVDESGRIYHFKNHAFRHTYAMKLLNNGASILTVQELLAHRSPAMTMVYAKLLDRTKYKEFSKAVRNGAFRFGGADGSEIVFEGEVPEDVLRALWLNHKLNAVDTPYGTCLQRKNGACGFAKQPPCLTCNDGRPCNDLCVGAFEGDREKYEILISSTEKLHEMAMRHGREDMASENEALLGVLKDVKAVLDQGGIIYGRIDRLRG